MSALSRILRNVDGGGLMFWCPGCKEAHIVWHGEGPGPRWTWNGDAERPVFGPSVLVTSDRAHPPVTPANLEQWRREPWPQQKVRHVCHTFVGCGGAQPGQIVFLSDCTHELAGHTVDLPPMPSYRSREAPTV
jgi:hypothetical protein